MVTDRSSTAALLAVLAYFYPDLILVFAFLIALDITSHYAHLYRHVT
jgi:CDP-diacylglycerol--inositol 3-phosphatidyltransferase